MDGLSTNYPHDETLRHSWFALTGRTDKCRLCGCMVGEAMNWAGKDGGRFYEPCRAAIANATGETA